MDVPQLLVEIDGELSAQGSPERAVQERACLKSRLDHYGASVPAVRAVAKRVAKRRPPLGRDELLALVDALWVGTVYERRRVAVVLLELCGDRLQPADMGMLERLLREAQTWALVDELAAVVVGGLGLFPRAQRALGRDRPGGREAAVRGAAQRGACGPLTAAPTRT
jgi:hypothetical protein